MADSNLKFTVDASEIDRLAIGGRLYDALSWHSEKVNPASILGFDYDTQAIIIKESDLMKLIQLVNQFQPTRKIKLVCDINPKDCE